MQEVAHKGLFIIIALIFVMWTKNWEDSLSKPVKTDGAAAVISSSVATTPMGVK